jgi:Cytidine and deoxycytidylate deaminase zinc-binding region.
MYKYHEMETIISRSKTLLDSNCSKTNCRNRHIACVFFGKKYVLHNYGINNVAVTSYISEHAEVNALKKLPPMKYNHPKEINLLVLRITTQGDLNMSKPCIHCVQYMTRLRGYKLKHIYYSSSTGDIVRSTLAQLCHDTSPHYSRGSMLKK